MLEVADMGREVEKEVRECVILSVLAGSIVTYFGSVALGKAAAEGDAVLAAAYVLFLLLVLAGFIEAVTDFITEALETSVHPMREVKES